MRETTKQLGDAIILIVLRGAAEYLRAHNLAADKEALSACCSSWAKLKLPEALADYKAAMECHMEQVGEATFKATMFQAGIEAAKECGTPKTGNKPEHLTTMAQTA